MAKAGARKAAREAGETRYFTGQQCAHGHVAERFVSTKACVECSAANAKRWSAENIGRVLAANKAWRIANPDRAKSHRRASYLRSQSKYYAAAKRRKLAQRTRTPAWADEAAINAVYAEARARRLAGEDVAVDHIIPLNGELVSGLHVHTNLQIMGARANKAKSNQFNLEDLHT